MKMLAKKTIPAGSVSWNRTRRLCSNATRVFYAFPHARTSAIPGPVDPLRLTLPVMPSTAAVPMDAETAAAYGLTLRGDARASGLFDRFSRGHTYLCIYVTVSCKLRCHSCITANEVTILRKG